MLLKLYNINNTAISIKSCSTLFCAKNYAKNIFLFSNGNVLLIYQVLIFYNK